MDEADDDFEELPPSTMPIPLSVSVQGFTDPQVGERLGHAVAGVVSAVGSYIDVSKLDGLTIACDYDQALARLDRGLEGLRPLSRSDTKEMQGVAMSPAVMRDGEVRTHLVFDAAYVVPLIHDDATDEDRRMTYGLIGGGALFDSLRRRLKTPRCDQSPGAAQSCLLKAEKPWDCAGRPQGAFLQRHCRARRDPPFSSRRCTTLTAWPVNAPERYVGPQAAGTRDVGSATKAVSMRAGIAARF